MKLFESVISSLLIHNEKNPFVIFEPAKYFNINASDPEDIVCAINSSFLIMLTGKEHPLYDDAVKYLNDKRNDDELHGIVEFYFSGYELIQYEIENRCSEDSKFIKQLKSLEEWLNNRENLINIDEAIERIWGLFFPEGLGLRENRKELMPALREKRTINIQNLNDNPIADPLKQMIFTSNVLLTIPSESTSIDELPYSQEFKKKLNDTCKEKQVFWYDHPIQIGVEPESNEVLYGLNCLDEAIQFERVHGGVPVDKKMTCILSVSVTHKGLQNIGKRYLEEEFKRSGGFKNLDIYVFTEADTLRIINKILKPAAENFKEINDFEIIQDIFGVDGEYGRHYSFLKAITALWNVMHDNEKIASFKIDLDQVFPQKELVEQGGSSALENFTTPLWGATGTDSNGNKVDIGMIAGILVNEKDIEKSLFTPDVKFPDRSLNPDEFIFFSQLPQAFSTEGELMTHYDSKQLDGGKTCIQRIHVTGGTNGILVDSLRHYRPFTPSFIGRAEDQAYILSVLSNSADERLIYLHKDGLVMRHDKNAFAQKAIESAYIGKLIGDYVRILYFSSYAKALSVDTDFLKEEIDPFTGCFVSKIPLTVVFLRFALKAASFFADGKEEGIDFVKKGFIRILNAVDFSIGDENNLKKQYEKEKKGWDLYYNLIDEIEKGIASDYDFANELKTDFSKIVNECIVDY